MATSVSEQLLLRAAAVQAERGKQYDKGQQAERSMERVVQVFNTIYGTQLSEYQGWKFMEILKIVRGANGVHEDSEVDCISYAALAAEARLERTPQLCAFVDMPGTTTASTLFNPPEGNTK